jgi:hypothetical protein
MPVDKNYLPDSKLRKKDLFFDERENGKVSLCLECGREFIIDWLVPEKGHSRMIMKKCARCYFPTHK